MVQPLEAFSIGRLPRITFGPGRFAEVPAIVASHGARVLLVTGGRSFGARLVVFELYVILIKRAVTNSSLAEEPTVIVNI